ncbi:MAG TPA: pilin [Candidatus Paceibacterota bacterium]|nr:pilin [Candidatus Paceibacterota bacterium]
MKQLLILGASIAFLMTLSLPLTAAAQAACTGENFGVAGTCQPAASCNGNNADTSPTCPSGDVCCAPSPINTGASGSNQASAPAPSGYVSGFVPLVTIPGITQGGVANSISIQSFLNELYKYLIGVAAVLAVIEIIWGGLEISTKDSVSKQSDGKRRIREAILGLVLILSPVLIFSVINPSILNLSINIQPLPTAGGTNSFWNVQSTPQTTATTQSQSAAASATAAGCTVTGTLLKKASCPTQQAAQDFATACTTGTGTVSSSWFSSTYQATCDTTTGPITGPYSFADTSQSSGFWGAVNDLVGYSHYDPLASTPTNPNNGNDVLHFASACTTDGGTTCMSAIKLPCVSSVVQLLTGSGSSGGSASCWNISLSCTDGPTGAGGCSSNPQFTIVNTQ